RKAKACIHFAIRGYEPLHFLGDFRREADVRRESLDSRRSRMQAQEVEADRLERTNGFAELVVHRVTLGAQLLVVLRRSHRSAASECLLQLVVPRAKCLCVALQTCKQCRQVTDRLTRFLRKAVEQLL